ncbi:cell division protein ZapA [Aquisediminimonas profunda]|uniref:cell division protein ZapA n=1 Tax=Aquisediminimonas profunda TaxID=1550733 RepID=UPI001C62E57A|nr:cell division protein ZapA [Aquisediminimonas profunda]
MAEVTLSVGGYQYKLACRDGEEAHLERLGEMVNAKAMEARNAVGNASEVRQLLLSALLFADETLEGSRGNTPVAAPAIPGQMTAALERLADRIELIATRVENLSQHS